MAAATCRRQAAKLPPSNSRRRTSHGSRPARAAIGAAATGRSVDPAGVRKIRPSLRVVARRRGRPEKFGGGNTRGARHPAVEARRRSAALRLEIDAATPNRYSRDTQPRGRPGLTAVHALRRARHCIGDITSCCTLPMQAPAPRIALRGLEDQHRLHDACCAASGRDELSLRCRRFAASHAAAIACSMRARRREWRSGAGNLRARRAW